MTTVSETDTGDFTPALGCLINPAVAGLAAQLGAVAELSTADLEAILRGVEAALYETVHRKTSRVLVLELNAARLTGQLTGDSPEQRWDNWLADAGRPEYWAGLGEHYPTLLARLRTVIDNRCAAALELARRFAADRAALSALLGTDAGQLLDVGFGAGDSHRGGRSVAILRCAGGTVVYKPRSVRVDEQLAQLLPVLLPDEPTATRIRVPRVVARDGYGWAEHVAHRYCAGEAELVAFYRGIGHWLAVMRLLGGVDLHAENLIACGPVPLVVDCETLFTPIPVGRPSGLGRAVDVADRVVDSTVLRIGLLPGRGVGLGWRGVDTSAVGSLPGQQPTTELPVLRDAGTDHASIGLEQVPMAVAGNHPSPEPALARYWQRIVDGFVELTGMMSELDRAGSLENLLAGFADCPIRVVARPTEVYAELARMLWHPVSLHDERAARERAQRLLLKMSEAAPLASGDAEVVAAEVEDLLDGDVPFFTTIPRRGRLDGPRGTAWLPELDLVADALARWRGTDLAMDRQVIQAALVSAYLNEGWLPDGSPLAVTSDRADRLDQRRRDLIGSILCRLTDAAIRGDDGTVTWIAPVLNDTGWAVQPLSQDLYGGLPGVAVLLAAQLHEAAYKRCDAVPGVEALLEATLRTMRAAEDRRDADRRSGTDLRPAPPGGYIGLGSQIWAWLALDALGFAGPDGLVRACALAELMPAAVKSDRAYEVLTGMAGAIPVLLWLAERSGQQRWTDEASAIGDRLVAEVRLGDGTAFWSSPRWPDGLGGFAHGVTGIGWALGRLAAATGQGRYLEVARAAFAFEESTYRAEAGGWRDLRSPDGTAAAWCHGAVGIGLAAMDLARVGVAESAGMAADVVSRAARSAWRDGLGWNHTACHGDLGCWELLDAAVASGQGPQGLDRTRLTARLLSSLEEHGPVSGLAREAFAPGLLAGEGSIAYQLLRMHPDSDLPLVLTLGGRP